MKKWFAREVTPWLNQRDPRGESSGRGNINQVETCAIIKCACSPFLEQGSGLGPAAFSELLDTQDGSQTNLIVHISESLSP